MLKNKSKQNKSFLPSAGGVGGGSYIEVQIDGPIARVSLNRPERHNTLILELIEELEHVLDEISAREDLHFIVLSGKGRSFCAGADLNWFYSSEQLTLEENTERYLHLARLLLKLYQVPQITIATVWGNVFGGGIGLMAVCDFVLAENKTSFMFSEVKLGLIPATILPFVAKRLSIQNLRKWILTGNMFSTEEAVQSGLIDKICKTGEMETCLTTFMSSFTQASPAAMKKAKQLINQVSLGEIDGTNPEQTAKILAEALLSPDGQEGINAFLEKRKPEWK